MEVSPVPVPGRDPRSLDAYTPSEVAQRVRTAGVEDARRGIVQTFALSLIGGSMLGLAAAASTAAMSGNVVGYGISRVIGGLILGLGLALVMTGGGELFTSNNLISMAWVSRQVRTTELAANWAVVYVGNAIGAASIPVLLVVGGAYNGGGDVFGGNALAIAAAKTGQAFEQDIALGIIGNTLVCMAVWLCFGARTTTDRILACVLPMAVLVTLNADHVVANFHYLTTGLLLRDDPAAVAASGLDAAALESISLTAVLSNLGAVTIGNIIGGSVLVAAVYWFVYLRPSDKIANGQAATDPGAMDAPNPGRGRDSASKSSRSPDGASDDDRDDRPG